MFSAQELRLAIISQDVKTIAKAPGIGAKTAQRMLIDLKDKVSIEEAFEKHLMKWKKQRVSPVSMAIIRLACYEIMYMADIPARVSINEAIELSKKYDDDKSYAFINGVLNAVASEFAE